MPVSLSRQVASAKEKAVKADAKNGRHGSHWLPHVQRFTAIATCTLDADAAAYRLSVETPEALDMVLLQVWTTCV